MSRCQFRITMAYPRRFCYRFLLNHSLFLVFFWWSFLDFWAVALWMPSPPSANKRTIHLTFLDEDLSPSRIESFDIFKRCRFTHLDITSLLFNADERLKIPSAVRGGYIYKFKCRKGVGTPYFVWPECDRQESIPVTFCHLESHSRGIDARMWLIYIGASRESLTHNPLVEGSSPSGPTIFDGSQTRSPLI